MKKELTKEQNEIVDTVINNITEDNNEELFKLLEECNINKGNIMIAMLGIGSHTEYYRVLYNRVNNEKEKMNDDLFKKIVVEILHEIDRNEDE